MFLITSTCSKRGIFKNQIFLFSFWYLIHLPTILLLFWMRYHTQRTYLIALGKIRPTLGGGNFKVKIRFELQTI